MKSSTSELGLISGKIRRVLLEIIRIVQFHVPWSNKTCSRILHKCKFNIFKATPCDQRLLRILEFLKDYILERLNGLTRKLALRVRIKECVKN